jgi:hypothetical protein
MSSRGELRITMAVVAIVTAGCGPEVRVDAGARGTGGAGTGGATQGTSETAGSTTGSETSGTGGTGGSGSGGQGASSSGASGGSHVAGCDSDGGELDPSGYPDGGQPLPGSGWGCGISPCPTDEFCWWPNVSDNCGYPYPKIMVLGQCMKRPTECINGGPGVCGCDGKWYCNECQANAAGYSIGPTWRCPP